MSNLIKMSISGRHGLCKLPSTNLQKRPVQSFAKNETVIKNQIKDMASTIEAQRLQLDGFEKKMVEMKALIISKDDEIASQSATLQMQQKQNNDITKRLADLTTESRSKNNEIGGQVVKLETQCIQIGYLSTNLSDLKADIRAINLRKQNNRGTVDDGTENRKDGGKATEKFVSESLHT